MLTGIHVKNLALIDDIEVEFSENLNILTGETGAGKSILIGAVSAALGGKISKDLIRRGSPDALVELFFTTADPQIANFLQAREIEAADGQILISRKITPARSVSRINGEAVSVRTVQELGRLLVDIHGQHEHESLLHREYHLQVLDAFAEPAFGSRLTQLKNAWQAYAAVTKQLRESEMDADERRRSMSFLEFEINEITQAQLTNGEDEQLQAAYRRMSNSRQIMEAAGSTYRLTGYSGGAGDAIGRALRQLSGVQDYDGALGDLCGQLTDIDNLLNDFNRELSGYMEEMVFDEAAYAQVSQRLDQVNTLKAKYGATIADILDYCEQARQKLDKLRNYDACLQQLHEQEKKAQDELTTLAQEVSQIRRQQADILSAQITQALQDLNFPDVRFDCQFERRPLPGEKGIDDVQFLIALNPGEELKPLAGIASGGELSRIMLAIKTVLADADAIETLIFDEIDTGISGRTAQKVAQKLAVISRRHQVLCITHLPQIAAMADSHYRIEKDVADAVTQTKVTALTQDGMIDEIARLLGGVTITDAVMENAREMKQLAEELKRNTDMTGRQNE